MDPVYSCSGLVPSPTSHSLVVITRSTFGHKNQEEYDGFQTILEILSLICTFLFKAVSSHSEMHSDLQ